MIVAIHDIDKLLTIAKTGLMGSKKEITFRVLDKQLEQVSIVTKLQLEPFIESGRIQIIECDSIDPCSIFEFYSNYGFGISSIDLMILIDCKKNNYIILTDDIAISRICKKEFINGIDYDQIIDYLINIEIQNDNGIKIKKSGRKPT